MVAADVERYSPSVLIRRARAGDEFAFGELVAEHEQLVLRTAWRLVGNAEDARDIAQETFLRLHRHIRRFDPDRELGPWLYRVTVNLGLTALRRRKRKPESQLGATDLATGPVIERTDQDRRDDAAHARRILAVALDRLSQKERAAVVLRDLEGLDMKDVARALGCRKVTVRAYLSRGRLKLRNALGTQGDTP